MRGDVHKVADRVVELVDLTDTTLPTEYNYGSLPLCVIDAVFSIGVRYESTARTVRSWCAAQEPRWSLLENAEKPEPSISDFVAVLTRYEPEVAAAKFFQNRQRTSSRSGILKADAVLRFAKTLQENGVEKFGDTLDATLNDTIEAKIRRIPGQTTGLSFTYFLMLAGDDGFVKADRMLQRFLSDALGRTIGAPEIADLMVEVAALLQNQLGIRISPRFLDYKVWSFQRGQAPA